MMKANPPQSDRSAAPHGKAGSSVPPHTPPMRATLAAGGRRSHIVDERTFTIQSNGMRIPMLSSDQAVADFEATGLDAMNDCLARLRINDQTWDSDEELVAAMFADALDTGHTKKLVLCTLWMAHTHPEVTGLVKTARGAYFITGDHPSEFKSKPH